MEKDADLMEIIEKEVAERAELLENDADAYIGRIDRRDWIGMICAALIFAFILAIGWV